MPHTTADITFADRRDAGERSADALAGQHWTDPLVLGLARGGIPVADAVAERLDAPLGVLVARKIGAPGHPEFGVGAATAALRAVAEARPRRVVSLLEAARGRTLGD